ncbi:MAG: response regulator, partial [Desulfobacteraceae bacterium]
MEKSNSENKNARILVVDDDLSVQKLYERLLSQLNHKVYCVGNGAQALQMIPDINPDLILMDADMPHMNGFEATKQIKENHNTRAIPVIMITGLNDTEHRIKALDAGVDDFLAKPPEKAEIIATIRSQLKVKAYNDTILDYQRTLEQAVTLRTDQLNSALTQLKDSSLEIIYRLSAASEYRDEDTGAHIQRMSNYTAIIAEKMGLGNKVVESIKHAAPMHDIGKIGIPDSILLKPGKLTDSEWAV